MAKHVRPTGGSYCCRFSSYVFPERQRPLKACFYNPSGYACCNRDLNDEIVRTYQQLINDPTFNPCNIQRLVNTLQKNCARRFKMDFEAIVGLSDYAQRVNFKKDLVCKVELGQRYMLVYATPSGDRMKRNEDGFNTTEEAITSTTLHSLVL
ncbi:unnamed protein product [Cylicocyclus nassatus]|uniref:Ground-like domain-containing protein n=1 Tax=Cylicocyclus nassatus TaxID=53992 RepID=A0AA36HGA2_CYLNA|nr:unnamed protein product [Cylicocyclus nassatus]